MARLVRSMRRYSNAESIAAELGRTDRGLPSLPIHPEIKVLHQEHCARNQREQSDDPNWNGKSDHQIQTEDNQEEGKKETRHVGSG